MKKSIIFLSLGLFILTLFASKSAKGQQKEEVLIKEINAFVDQWHSDAAHANKDYFKKIDEHGVFIGTDKKEVWTREEFYNFSKKYFDRGKAWDFKATERHIYFSDNKNYAWFDELLDTWMGPCRSSGVLKHAKNGWLIVHYQLSLAVPNEIIKEVIKLIKTSDSTAVQK